MKINKTNDDLIKINRLKNLRSITFKDLYKTSANDKFLVLPGFIISSESAGFMYLTNQDEYFEDFVRKIRELYLDEKDNVYEDGILGEKRLEIDPLTRSILLNGTVENTSDLYKFYKGKTSYNESLLFEEDELNSFKGIIIHHLKETMKLFDITIKNFKLSEGVNGTYYLSAELNNRPVIIPLCFRKTSDKTFEIMIGNLFENSIPLRMEITFENDGISVSNTISEYGLSDYTKYEFKKEGTIEREVLVGDELKHYKKENLPLATNVPINLITLDNTENANTWYKLPWNAYEGVTVIDNSIEEDGSLGDSERDDRLITKRLVYLAEEAEDFYIRDAYSKRYRKKEQGPNKKVEITFDSLEKQIIGLKEKDGFIIETKFMGNAVTGFYKTHLLGNNFYHISNAKTKKDLTGKTIKSIGKEEGLQENVDLLDIKKYIK